MSTRTSRSAPSLILSIQGLRAIAILLVVGYHAGAPIGAGFVGVDIFFVISGFVITRMLARKITADGGFGLRWFWAGRIRRLLPAMTLMVLGTLLISIPVSSPVQSQQVLALSAMGAITWVANGVLAAVTWGYFVPGAESNPFLHTWSLAVEEQFYVIFPLIVGFALWIGHRRRGRYGPGVLIGMVAVASAASFAISAALTFVPLPLPVGLPLAFYSPFSRAWEFGVGILIALLLQRWEPRGAVVTNILGLLGAGLVVVGLVACDDPRVFPGYVVLLPVLGAGLLVLVAESRTPLVGALSWRPLVFIGGISYGWYLYHWPLLVLGRSWWRPGASPAWIDVLAVVVSFGLAVLSYRYLEEPVRHRRVLADWRARRFGLVMIGVPMVLCSLVIYAVNNGWWNQNVRDFRAATSHAGWKYQAVCQDQAPISRRSMGECRFEGAADQPGFILLGDSNAGMYADTLVRAGRELDRSVTVASIPTCEVNDQRTAVVGIGITYFIDCRQRYDDTLGWLAEQKPSIVLVASGQTPVDRSDLSIVDRDGTSHVGYRAKSAGYRDSLVRTYERITAMGHTVVPVTTIPKFVETESVVWMPSACKLVTVLGDPDRCGRTMTRAEADAREAGTLGAEAAAVRAVGLQHLDFRDQICPGDVCRTNRGDFWVYEDGAHLSYRGAMLLLPEFVKQLPLLRWPPAHPRPASPVMSDGRGSGDRPRDSQARPGDVSVPEARPHRPRTQGPRPGGGAGGAGQPADPGSQVSGLLAPLVEVLPGVGEGLEKVTGLLGDLAARP